MDAHKLTNDIMFAALDRGERERERIQTEPVQGQCWECVHYLQGMCRDPQQDTPCIKHPENTCKSWEVF